MTALDSLREKPKARALAAIGTFVIVFALLLSLLPSAGLTDDDDFYAPAAKSYAGWLGDVVTSPTSAFTKATIDRAFNPNHEHPPVAKYAMGIAHAVTHRALGVLGDLDGARSGTSLLAALLCAVLVLLLWRPLGPLVAVAAPLMLLSLPRFLFHAQVATLDVPVAAMVVFTTAFFFWGETSARFAWASGLVFGLAMATKLNAPFAVFPATLYALLGRWRGFSVTGRGASSKTALHIPPLPRALVAMAIVGPIVFLAVWPWMWFDTFPRLGAYFGFHLGHYPILNFVGGEVYTKPHAPWHFAFTMAGAAMPLPVVVLGLIGTVRALASVRLLAESARTDGALPDVDEGDRLRALLVLQALFAIGIVAFLPVPKYGGEKLFMPFFALFAALAADGARITAESVRTFLPRVAHGPALAVVVVLALIPGVNGSVDTRGGYGLSYFSETVGGIRTMVAKGYERTYYDIADKPLARTLDEMLTSEFPNELRVRFEPNHKEYARTYRWMQRDGVISRRVNLVGDIKKADVVVLTHERRWSTYPALLDTLSVKPVLHEKRIDGVPLYTVYRAR
jgi:4-amino-4-deoxy-L-arabinose transferase-like glycosyltransferase